jgi:hypothetical protein
MRRPRTKTIDGYRIQPGLSETKQLSLGLLGASCVDAHFTEYDGTPCVEALVRIGNGMIKNPYSVILSLRQAREADLIEEV